MDMGTVVALIKGLAPKTDPAVIEQAVQDWLDDHPEATTTVEDGSITEAKLAADVAGILDDLQDDVTDVENALQEIDSQIFKKIEPTSKQAASVQIITDAMMLPIASGETSFIYTQEGSGESALDNVRNFVGYSSCIVNVSGTDDPQEGKNYTIPFSASVGDNGTAYGGTVDIVNKKLVLTHRKHHFVSDPAGGTPLTNTRRYSVWMQPAAKDSTRHNSKSNKLKYLSEYNTDSVHFYVDAEGWNGSRCYFFLPNDGTSYEFDVVYELKNPIEYNLTGDNVILLEGTNYITCNMGNIALAYYSHNINTGLSEISKIAFKNKEALNSVIPEVNSKLMFSTPEMFGAVGDGSADDTNAINSAIAYALENKVPMYAYKRYKVTSSIVINGSTSEIYIRALTANFDDFVIKYSGIRSFIKITSLYNQTGGGIYVTVPSTDATEFNTFEIGWVYVTNKEALKIEGPTDRGIYYNVFRVVLLKSTSANAITIIGGYGENKFYGGKLITSGGWAISIKDSGFNKMYGFSIESDCFAGILLDHSTHNEFMNFRDIELIMKRRTAEAGSDKGLLLKFIGASLCNKYFTADRIFLDCIDISQSRKLKYYYENNNNSSVTSTGLRNFITTDDNIDPLNEYSVQQGMMLMPIHTNRAKECVITLERIIVKPSAEIEIEVGETLDYTVNDFANFATHFIITEDDSTIKLHSAYCSEGYDHFNIYQKTGASADVVDFNGIPLFEGSNYGEGIYKFKAVNAPKEVFKGKITYVDPANIPGWNDGENDIWYVTKNDDLIEKTHLAKNYIEPNGTINFTSSIITTPSWESSDTSVATVNNGTVTAVSEGVAVITATGNGQVERWVVTVITV